MKIFSSIALLIVIVAPSKVVEAGCKKEGQYCFDAEKLEYEDDGCCEGLTCTVAWDQHGEFKPQCMNDDDATAILNEFKTDFANKDQICDNLESTLDNYYKTITNILGELEENQESPNAEMDALLIGFMCKNLDPMDPGVRDHAAYARFDYIEKCSQADAANCLVKLAEATNKEYIMMRKMDPDYGEMGRILYQFVSPEDVEEKQVDEYLVDTDCFYFESPPFVFKPTPFEPSLLNETCGDAGYEYYVE